MTRWLHLFQPTYSVTLLHGTLLRVREIERRRNLHYCQFVVSDARRVYERRERDIIAHADTLHAMAMMRSQYAAHDRSHGTGLGRRRQSQANAKYSKAASHWWSQTPAAAPLVIRSQWPRKLHQLNRPQGPETHSSGVEVLNPFLHNQAESESRRMRFRDGY